MADSKKPSSIKVELPGIITPSNNVILRWKANRHFSNIKALKKMYWDMLHLCKAHYNIYQVEPEQKRIVVFRSFRKRLLDHDNLVGGCKYLLDTLEKIGLIYKDSPRYIEVSYFQQKCKHERTEIYLYNMDKEEKSEQDTPKKQVD